MSSSCGGRRRARPGVVRAQGSVPPRSASRWSASPRSVGLPALVASLLTAALASVLAGCSDPPDRERVDAAIAAGSAEVAELVAAVADEGVTDEQADELLGTTGPRGRPLPSAVLDAVAEPGADGEPSRDDAVGFARHLLEADGEATLRAAAAWVDGLLAPVYLPGVAGDPVPRTDLAALVAHAAPTLGLLAEAAEEGDVSIPGDDDLGPQAACRFVANVAREMAVDALVDAGVVDGDLDVEGRVAGLVDHLGEDTHAELRAACVDAWSAADD